MTSPGQLISRWYRSRIYFAWANRCLLCLIHPYHGNETP